MRRESTFHALLSFLHLYAQIVDDVIIIPELIIAQVVELSLYAMQTSRVLTVVGQEPKALLWERFHMRVRNKTSVVCNSCLIQPYVYCCCDLPLQHCESTTSKVAVFAEQGISWLNELSEHAVLVP